MAEQTDITEPVKGKKEAIATKPSAKSLPEPKGVYSTDFYKDNGIATCSHCGDKESQSCSEGLDPDLCPMLAVKSKTNI